MLLRSIAPRRLPAPRGLGNDRPDAARAPLPTPVPRVPAGTHHFVDGCFTEPTEDGLYKYQCKHCDETAEVCDECFGAIWPNTGQAVCDECTANRGDFE